MLAGWCVCFTPLNIMNKATHFQTWSLLTDVIYEDVGEDYITDILCQ